MWTWGLDSKTDDWIIPELESGSICKHILTETSIIYLKLPLEKNIVLCTHNKKKQAEEHILPKCKRKKKESVIIVVMGWWMLLKSKGSLV